MILTPNTNAAVQTETDLAEKNCEKKDGLSATSALTDIEEGTH